jgi:hypothetical protein
MKNSKRILALLLTLTLMVGICPSLIQSVKADTIQNIVFTLNPAGMTQDNLDQLPAGAADRSTNVSVFDAGYPKYMWVQNFGATANDYLTWHISSPAAHVFTGWLSISTSTAITYQVAVTQGGTTTTTTFTTSGIAWEKVQISNIQIPTGSSTLKITQQTAGTSSAGIKGLDLIVSSDLAAYQARVLAFKNASSTTALRFSQSGYGLFFQYGVWGYPQYGDKKSAADATNAFNVSSFVQMVQATGAKYIIWSITWVDYHMQMPVNAVNTIMENNSLTTTRNLVGEVAAACKANGIDFYLYYHQGIQQNVAWAAKQNFPSNFNTTGTGDRSTFFNNWVSVISEIGQTLGTNLDGWMFDDGCVYYPAPFERLGAAARVGNPARLISYNDWIGSSITDFQNVCFNEGSWGPDGNSTLDPATGVYTSGRDNGLNCQAMPQIENGGWGITSANETISSNISASNLIIDVNYNMALHVPSSLNIKMWEDGTIGTDTMNNLLALKAAIRGGSAQSISGATFDPIANQTYTGSAITPTITVKYGATTLVLNTDYTISYSNNINVGTATVTITGIGNYNNTASTTFTISNGGSGATIYGNDTSSNTTRTGSGWSLQSGSKSCYSVTANDAATFTVNVQNTGDTIKWYGIAANDHGIANVYIDGVQKATVDCYSTTRLVDTLLFTSASMSSGNHTIKIVVTGTHNASANGTYIEIYRIVDFTTSAKSISGVTFDPIANQTYTGSAITPTITVKDGTTTLVLNTDYTVSYSNNVNVGTATVTITGIGNYNNTASTTFTISNGGSGATIYGNDTSSNTTRTGSGWGYQSTSSYSSTANDSVTFTMNVQNTGDTIKWYSLVGDDHGIANVYIDDVFKSAVDCYSTTRLVDTLVFTSASMSSGNHTIKIVVTGTHNASANGTYIEIYRIVDFTTSAKSISGVTFDPIANQTYTGSAITPTITVKDGTTTLVLNTDYTILYSNNINVGTATVTITGIGNYNNTASTTFTISNGGSGATIYGNDTSSNTTRTGSGWALQSGSNSCYSYVASDSATFTVNVQNTGDTIKWYGVAGSDHGIANVYIDGVQKATVDCYSATRLVDTLLFTSASMSSGNHTIKIVVTGTHNASANGTYIEIYRIVDFATSAPTTIYGNDTSSNTTRTGSGWGLQSTSSYSSTANDSVTFSVNVQNTGDTIKWYSLVGDDHGIANVYIDDVFKSAVDCYSTTRLVDTLVFTSDPMSSGNHTIKIVVTGTHNASAVSNYIEIYRILF